MCRMNTRQCLLLAFAGVVCILAAAGQTGQQAVEQIIKQLNNSSLKAKVIGSCRGTSDSEYVCNAADGFSVNVDKV